MGNTSLFVCLYCLVLELEDDLQSAEARCNLLEKQLDYMRKMVQTAETDRDTAIQRSAMVAKQTAQQTSDEIRGQLEKLAGLERDHMKLTASHSIAEVSLLSQHTDQSQYPINFNVSLTSCSKFDFRVFFESLSTHLMKH